MKKVIDALGLPVPYCVRVPTPKECIYFLKPNEISVYMSFFDVGLCFPLDGDQAMVLHHYYLPSCRYTPTLIGYIVSFLSLIFQVGVPFSFHVLQYLFQIQVQKVKDGCVWGQGRTEKWFTIPPT